MTCAWAEVRGRGYDACDVAWSLQAEIELYCRESAEQPGCDKNIINPILCSRSFTTRRAGVGELHITLKQETNTYNTG